MENNLDKLQEMFGREMQKYMIEFAKRYNKDCEDYFVERIKEASNHGVEEGHYLADGILCDLLEAIGYKKVVEEYNKINKWYA